MSIKSEPMRVMLMRRGEFADLPTSVRLVHLEDKRCSRSKGAEAEGKGSLSPSLIKRSPRA
jgi:hypothetical protein